MDRFREMETFTAVVEEGSFVRAAEKLRISKSVVSRIVQDLEIRLEGKLLQRTTRRLALTAIGQSYYQRCRQILDELVEAESAVGMDREKAFGLLKVSVPTTFGIRHLAPLWGDFLLRYPQVRLDIALLDRQVDLIGEGYDLAIRIASRQNDSSLVSRKLASSRIILCAAPRYLEQHGTPQALDDLQEHDFIGYSYLSTGDVWKLKSASSVEGIKTQPRLRANNGDTCRAAALQGLGIIAQPGFVIEEDLRDGRLVEILPDWQPEERGIYAVYPTRQYLSGKVRALIDYLEEAFRHVSWNCLAQSRDDQPA